MTTTEPIRLPDAPKDEPRSNDVVISVQTFYYLVIAVIFFVAGFAVAWVAFNTTTANLTREVRAAAGQASREAVGTAIAEVVQSGGGAAAAQPTAIPVYSVEIGDAPFWGPEDAPVTIVEYSDFECVFCESFTNNTYPLLKRDYGDRVKFVFKHFPVIQIHPNAENAAFASECAREQGKFWEYHDILFLNRQALTIPDLKRYAAQVGVENIEQFNECLDTQKYRERVLADMRSGNEYNVGGTPTFFINGKPFVGAQPYQLFVRAIEDALTEASGG
jgi:protein-disulfide isomerase